MCEFAGLLVTRICILQMPLLKVRVFYTENRGISPHLFVVSAEWFADRFKLG